MSRPVTLSARGERDLRHVPAGDRKNVSDGLRRLGDEAANNDVKPLAGHSGWYRLRVGAWRVLYYADSSGIVIERIVNRRDLERAVRGLA